MLIPIIRNIKGFVKVKITGFSPERFLNLCSHHKILVWDLKSKENAYEMCMTIQGFFLLKPILKKTKTQIVILEKHGLPFFFHKYRKRKIFFFGILFCVFCIYLCSNFVWNIDITGSESRKVDEILGYLDEEGIYHGIRKAKVDCNEIVMKLREKYDNIIWVSAKIQGTRLFIQVQERTDTVLGVEEDDTPSSLVATRDGIIDHMITRAGMPLVTVGDSVLEGDPLILGVVEIKDDSGTVISRKYLPADGDIDIKTIYSYEDEFPMKYEERIETGNTKKRWLFSIMDAKLEVFPWKNRFEYFDEEVKEKQWKLTENFYLPIWTGKKIEKEYTLQEKVYSKEEAIKEAQQRLNKTLEEWKEKGISIVENRVKIEVDKNHCKAVGEILVIEKAVKRSEIEEIEISPGKDEG